MIGVMKKLKLVLLSLVASVSLMAVPVYAQSTCGSTKTQLISCSDASGIGAIGDLIKIAIVVLTILIGVVAVGGLAYAAILYASARDNQSQLDQSKTIIRNIIIGLVLYGFTIVIVNWLVPGGVITSPAPSPSPTTSPSSSLLPS